MARHDILRGELRAVGLADRIASVQRLPGGLVADAWLVTYADGTRVAGKTLTGAPADVFRVEAEGLAALRETGHLQTPEVLAVTGRLLLLEALAARDDSGSTWDAFAHDLATLHRGTVYDRFAGVRDGYLGRGSRRNTRATSGQLSFSQLRVCPFVDVALSQQYIP